MAKLGVSESTITLIRSFHKGMKAAIRLGGRTLEEITVENGLRRGCCKAPVYFNLYMCLAVERWLERVEGENRVGINVKYKMDRKLFRQYTRDSRIMECKFTDDSALLASTRSGAVKTVTEYQQTGRDFGLMVSIPKTKHMVTGRLVEEGNHTSVSLAGGNIDVVEEFPYLGSKTARFGRSDVDVDRRIVQASKAFGATAFMDKNLTLTTKRRLYDACVVSVLLYGAEYWTPLRKHEKRLNTFTTDVSGQYRASPTDNNGQNTSP